MSCDMSEPKVCHPSLGIIIIGPMICQNQRDVWYYARSYLIISCVKVNPAKGVN